LPDRASLVNQLNGTLSPGSLHSHSHAAHAAAHAAHSAVALVVRDVGDHGFWSSISRHPVFAWRATHVDPLCLPWVETHGYSHTVAPRRRNGGDGEAGQGKRKASFEMNEAFCISMRTLRRSLRTEVRVPLPDSLASPTPVPKTAPAEQQQQNDYYNNKCSVVHCVILL